MDTKNTPAPQLRAGYWTWSFQGSDCQILFVGRGPQRQRTQAFEDLVDDPGLRLSWPHQIHSATVLEADHPGLCGQADAMTTRERGVVLSVATADCVPIVVESRRHLATIHAGWRGLANHIIQHTLDDLTENPGLARAWIGPAIGPCCYEVGRDVAGKVVAASDPNVLTEKEPRPHLDLVGAARFQLMRAGVEQVHTVSVCTRCSPEWLWSYRRDRDGAGRNWSFAWRSADHPEGSGTDPGTSAGVAPDG